MNSVGRKMKIERFWQVKLALNGSERIEWDSQEDSKSEARVD